MSAEGTYRIQAVAEKTGLPAGTLRAWERRYGIPKPGRSASEYRLYTARDVEVVLRMKALVNGGLAPAEAARAVLADVAREDEELVPDVVATRAIDPFADAVQRIVDGVKRFDVIRAEEEVTRALCLGSALQVCERIFVPAMREIGECWHAGEIGVAEEHFASETIGNMMRSLLRGATPVDCPDVVVLGCFAEEQHALPLHVIGLQLANAGMKPIVLGARTPPEAVAAAVERLAPRLVGLSVTVPPPRRDAEALVIAYARACGKTPWVVGGRAAGELAEYVTRSGGLLAEPSSSDFRELLRRLPRVGAAS